MCSTRIDNESSIFHCCCRGTSVENGGFGEMKKKQREDIFASL
jgi:hypothetical protein